MTTQTYGTLYDYTTGQEIGPATREQWEASLSQAAGETGAITIDADGEVRHPSDDTAAYGQLRTVYVAYVEGGPDA